MKQKNHLQLYLSRYAEPNTAKLADCIPAYKQYQHCLVIPAFNEEADFVKRIIAQVPDKLLLIVVINQPDSLPTATTENINLWNTISLQSKTAAAVLVEADCDILCIDRFHNPLPSKQGVGLARKIACDIACEIHHRGQLKSHWIHNSDADAYLPNTYWDKLPSHPHRNQKQISALLYPFEHQNDNTLNSNSPAINRATQAYEQSLNYYVDGLRFANSPYAYHTLGSCIVVSCHHYALVRGFPRRAGGEDFYLLNKLAKVGKIESIQGATIKLSARLSHRAPFGTGAAVSKMLAADETDILTYNPQIFYELRQVISLFGQAHKDQHLNELPEASRTVLRDLGIAELFQHLRKQSLSQALSIQHAHHWFDGFRTLKFIHKMESFYPRCRLEDAQRQIRTFGL